MAYAAVNSVLIAIYGFANSPGISLATSTQESLESACDQGRWLGITLYKCSEVVTALDERIIIEESRRLEDSVELALSAQYHEQSAESGEPTFPLALHHAHLAGDVACFAKMAEKMRGHIEELWEQKAAKMIEQHIVELCVSPREEEVEEEEEDVSSSGVDMVGHGNVFRVLVNYLSEPHVPRGLVEFSRLVVWISGMAGLGKTTLVKRAFIDPLVKANFECRAFVRVGREYRVERVLRAITAQLNRGHNMVEEGDDEDFYLSFLMTLSTKRCLIVLDDVWEIVLDNLVKRGQLIGDMGSLVLVTSRMEPEYVYPFLIRKWKMSFLNEEESWELLKKKVFDDEEGEECPRQLVEAGKKIAEKCKGLPLLIIAVANELRSNVPKNLESWNRVAEKSNSVLEDASNQISEVLLPSYNQLDELHKLYFLYVAAFPLNHVVFFSMITNLWYAEGFHYFISSYARQTYKSHVFRELLGKNVVILDLLHPSLSSNEMKACTLHPAYWYLCKRIAKDSMFLYVMNSYADGMEECVTSHRRLAIQTNVLFAITEVRDNIASISTVRSILCTGPYHQYQVPMCYEWKLLRVLDALTIRFYEFPDEVVKLIFLKYLAITCNANLPCSISKLLNLHFLIVHQQWSIKRVAAETYVPVQVWDLEQLIHLEIMERNLPDPPYPGDVLPNLTKLLGVGVESCTKGVLESLPNLKKLRVQIESPPNAVETLMHFDHISWMDNLESFQIVVMNPTLLHPPPPLSIPILSIKKLSLSGLGYSWEEMSKIGELPNLRVLKLKNYAFRGERWDVNHEMRFSSLQYLFIEDTDLMHWTINEENKLYLHKLTLRNCYKLREIPLLSLFMEIDLIDCNPLAEAYAKERYSTAEWITISATYSWKKKLRS